MRARTGTTAAGSDDDDDGERSRRGFPCFILRDCPRNRPRSPCATSLQPATFCPPTDPRLGTPDLSVGMQVKVLRGLDGGDRRRNSAVKDATKTTTCSGLGVVGKWEGRRELGEKVQTAAVTGETLGGSPPASPRGLPSSARPLV